MLLHQNVNIEEKIFLVVMMKKNMTFIGFVAFLDPPKKDVKSTIKKLKKYGITTKYITGDNQYATENIAI